MVGGGGSDLDEGGGGSGLGGGGDGGLGDDLTVVNIRRFALLGKEGDLLLSAWNLQGLIYLFSS